MNFSIIDNTYFDEEKRLFSEQRLTVPRDRLKPDLSLDVTLAYRLAALYFATLERSGRPLVKVEIDAGEIQVTLRGRGAALRFGVGEAEVSQARAAIRWEIIGGWAMNADAEDGGTYAVGAEWDEARENLILFARIDRYAPSLTGLKARLPRRLLYTLTQKQTHDFFTHRFLTQAARELTQAKIGRDAGNA